MNMRTHFNCSIFDGNNCGNGATIDLGFQSGMFSNIIFSNNRGSAIRVSLVCKHKNQRYLIIHNLCPIFKAIGSKLTFDGNASFMNNNAEGFDGGDIYMLTFSQMILYPGAHLRFANNTGGYDKHDICN